MRKISTLASNAAAGPPEGMKMYAFTCGTVKMDKSWITAGRGMGQIVDIPVPMFLISHPKGLVIFDTGMHPDVAEDALKYYGIAPFVNDIQPVMKPDWAINRQIEKLGFRLEDVKYVILSHLHFDHAGGMTLFPNSTFILREEELRSAWWPESYLRGYSYKDYKDTREYKFIRLGDEEYDVFGDGALICIDTKGHTPGHQALILNLPNSGMIVLTGDACYTRENLEERIVPGILWNPGLAIKAIDRFKFFQERYKAYIITGHDSDGWEKVKKAPEYYD